ncbi:PREDICTED: protein BFR2 [Brassica oleracea var. oleracea]|uniref:B box-type domain-containing protein n=1 Tax=Brassica oleracea var. oleracea TaxID=109376 RepID=A0A0D3A6W7_BRAOL|nr:PREDICTED: protein BFR2 [Brassica oleracea var. oleracea]
MGKKCDLCDGVARMYCESDQASLCWNCDAKVHGANFLVAKHTRCLLCSACQSPTPWKATGLRLGPTFSVCDSCVALKSAVGGGAGVGADQSQEVNEGQLRRRDDDGDSAESYDDGEDEDEDEEYSDEDEEEDDADDEEAENQVVPWSAAAAAQLPPVMSSSSSNGGGGDLAAKRTRDYSDEEIGCSSSAQESNFSPPLKRPSRDELAFKSTAEINSLVRLEGERVLERRR